MISQIHGPSTEQLPALPLSPSLPLPALQPLHLHTGVDAVSPPRLPSPSAAFLPVIHPTGKEFRLHSRPGRLPPAPARTPPPPGAPGGASPQLHFLLKAKLHFLRLGVATIPPKLFLCVQQLLPGLTQPSSLLLLHFALSQILCADTIKLALKGSNIKKCI